MGTGFERESPRPLVLRHAYQSETRRYTPRCPERTLLYRIVAENLEKLLQTARPQNESGLGLPKYVEKECRDYLRCGVLCHGFTRLVCEACGRTIFLSFSCKRRGTCSSCSARRMCNTAAVVVDRVLPEVPVRQWVLSTPFEIRLLLARNAESFGELTRLFMEEVLAQYRRRAAKLGIENCEGGALVFQHRFGGSLNLNTHLHACVVDGVFEKEVASDGTERVKFHALPPQHPAELTAVAHEIYRKFEVWLKKKGLMRLADADETYASEDALASCLRGSLGIGQVVELDEAADVQYSQEQADEKRFALRKSPHTGEFGGFSIHAGVTVHAADKDGRERLMRYCARPALSMERMSETSDGLSVIPEILASGIEVVERRFCVTKEKLHELARGVIDIDQQHATLGTLFEPFVITTIVLNGLACTGAAMSRLVNAITSTCMWHRQAVLGHPLA